jgi:hypothetical protein
MDLGAIKIVNNPDLDLTIAEIPADMKEFHVMPIHNASKGFRLLTIHGNQYECKELTL